MKIVLPVQDTLTLYKFNPYTAPKFAIYTINNINDVIHFSLDSIVDNPLNKQIFVEDEKECNCNCDKQNNFIHRTKHSILLESIQNCKYLLANKCCVNTQNTIKEAGVTLYKLPPIINKIDLAIKNFLIGASFARTIQNTRHVS